MVCSGAVLCVVTQRSSPQTAGEERCVTTQRTAVKQTFKYWEDGQRADRQAWDEDHLWSKILRRKKYSLTDNHNSISASSLHNSCFMSQAILREARDERAQNAAFASLGLWSAC